MDQLPLLDPPPFEPVRLGERHYVVVIQDHSGERGALEHLDASAWSRVTPFVHFVGRKSETPPLSGPRLKGWVKRVHEVVLDRPCFIDLLRIRPHHAATYANTTIPVLQAIYHECRKRRMNFVPVFPMDGSARHAELAAEASQSDGRGAAIRYLAREIVFPPSSSLERALLDVVDKLAVPITEMDVLFDLGFIDEDVELDVHWLAALIDRIDAVGRWRSLVFLGTSIPPTMSAIYEGSVGRIPRREWNLWQQLKPRVRRVPTFGDYGVQHPRPPEKGGGPGMRANIRYTLGNETLVARGIGSVVEVGNDQYRDLCKQLIQRNQFRGAKFSWGDTLIEQCGQGAREPKGQSMWRAAGTSHHLAEVISSLEAS